MHEVLYASALMCVKKIVIKATPNKQQLFPCPFGRVQLSSAAFEIWNLQYISESDVGVSDAVTHDIPELFAQTTHAEVWLQ